LNKNLFVDYICSYYYHHRHPHIYAWYLQLYAWNKPCF